MNSPAGFLLYKRRKGDADIHRFMVIYHILCLSFFAPTTPLKIKCYFAIKHIFSSERLHFQDTVSIITFKWSKEEQSGAKTHILNRKGGKGDG